MIYFAYLRKSFLILFSLMFFLLSSGLYVSKHHCYDCNKSNFSFFSQADCRCIEHKSKTINKICCNDNCYNKKCCSNNCIIKNSYYKLPSFPLLKTKLPNLEILKLQIYDLVLINNVHTLIKKNKTEYQNIDPPPLLKKSIFFIIFAHQQIIYN